MSDTLYDPPIQDNRCYLVIAAGYWGKSNTVFAALEACKQAGGRSALQQGWILFDAPDGIQVTDYGGTTYPAGVQGPVEILRMKKGKVIKPGERLR